MAIDDVAIANPWNTSQAMVLSQTDCPNNPRMGIAYVNGQSVGCWGTDPKDGSVWLTIENRNHHITVDQLNKNALQYLQANAGIPWQTIVEIGRSYQPTPPAPPPRTTYFYGSGGDYLGKGMTW